MKYAADRGWSVFAVQYNSECFTAPDAEHTYRKYGGANNCAHGRGGGWANSVYKRPLPRDEAATDHHKYANVTVKSALLL